MSCARLESIRNNSSRLQTRLDRQHLYVNKVIICQTNTILREIQAYSQCHTGLAVLNHKRLDELISISFSRHNITKCVCQVSTKHFSAYREFIEIFLFDISISRWLMTFVSWVIEDSTHKLSFKTRVWTLVCAATSVFDSLQLFGVAIVLLIIDTACLWTIVRDYTMLQGIAYIGIIIKPL